MTAHHTSSRPTITEQVFLPRPTVFAPHPQPQRWVYALMAGTGVRFLIHAEPLTPTAGNP